MPPERRERFLVIKLAALGDVLQATGLLRALRAARPGAHISVVTASECWPVLEHNPDIDAVVSLPTALLCGGGSWRAVWRQADSAARFWWRLRQERGGTVLILHRSPWLARVVRLAGVRHVIGFESPGNRWLSRAVPFDVTQHRLERLAALLRGAGIACGALQPRLELTADELQFADRTWAALGREPAPRVVLAPGGAANPWAAMPNRRWPLPHFIELARRLSRAGAHLVVVGGADDHAAAAAMATAMDGTPGIRLLAAAGSWSLRQSAAVIARADGLVGNDSAPLHLATALHTPALGLYGPTRGALIQLAGLGGMAQSSVPCSPCYDPRAGLRGRAYTCTHAVCMSAITVDQAWSALCHLLPPLALPASRRPMARVAAVGAATGWVLP